MIDNDKLKVIIDGFAKNNVKIRVRDIAFAILSQQMDGSTAYQCLFGTAAEEDYDAYAKSEEVVTLLDFLKNEKLILTADGEYKSITFDENRRAMEELIRKTEREMAAGTVEMGQGLKIISDIRVKLNDKFNVSEDVAERVIIVEKKFNDVCENCGHEIYVPTKEDMMEEYNLIEKPTE